MKINITTMRLCFGLTVGALLATPFLESVVVVAMNGATFGKEAPVSQDLRAMTFEAAQTSKIKAAVQKPATVPGSTPQGRKSWRGTFLNCVRRWKSVVRTTVLTPGRRSRTTSAANLGPSNAGRRVKVCRFASGTSGEP
jgi:hypothetical protein